MEPVAHLLIADDEDDLIEALLEIFAGEGYAITCVSSPAEALDALDAQVFGAVLTDGFGEGLEQVAAIVARARPTPVGLLSGWKVPDGEVARLGLRFALQKPVDIGELIARVAQMLGDPLHPAKHEAAALARRYFGALEEKDWDELRKVCAAGVRFAGPQGSRFAATLVGSEALLLHSQQTFQVFQDARFRDLVVYQTPGGVAVRYLGTWTSGGVPAQQAGTAILRIEDGRIARIGVEMNQALLDRLAP